MKSIKKFTSIFGLLILIWIGITTTIYRFKNKSTTETELFLHIPKSFVLNFNDL